MAEFIQEGKVIDYINSGASEIAMNDVIVGTDRIYIAMDNIPVGETGPAATKGVFEFTATTSQANTVGQKLYWDDTSKKTTTTAGSNVVAGYSTIAKTASGTKSVVQIG